MRGLKCLLTVLIGLLAAPATHAADIKISGTFTAKNIETLFRQLHTHRGKIVVMNVRIALPDKTSRHEIRASHCWVQLIDKASRRTIEWFNTSDYKAGPLTMHFKAVWEIQHIGTGKRPSQCGTDAQGVHAPNPGHIYALNPVG